MGADGRLLPDVVDAIAAPWDAPVAAAVEAYRALFGARLHSVYVRGSVARGTAVVGVADLDLHALLVGDAAVAGRSARRAAARALAAAHPWCAHFELRASPCERLRLDRPTPLGTMLSLLSVCVHGRDVRPILPRPRPGRESWIQLPRLARALDVARRDLDRDARSLERRCGWLARRIVRSGLELASLHEPVFSRDLYPCYRAFAHVYPDREREMHRGLELAIAPTPAGADLRSLLELGNWLTAAAARAEAVYAASSREVSTQIT